jgi:hypothetical protein
MPAWWSAWGKGSPGKWHQRAKWEGWACVRGGMRTGGGAPCGSG